MAQLSIRGLDDQVMAELKRRAAERNASVNTLVLQLLNQGLGRVQQPGALRRHDDLDALAGRWSAAEAEAFGAATAGFAEIDPAQWR